MEEIDGLPKKSPDLLIYLEGSFDHIMNNIKKNVDVILNSLIMLTGSLITTKLLHTHYNSWYENYQYSPKNENQTPTISMLQKSEDWAKVYQMIRQEMKSIGIGD